MSNLFYLVTLLPLAGFLINGLFGKKLKNEKLVGAISTLAVFIPFTNFTSGDDKAGGNTQTKSTLDRYGQD